MKTGKKTVIQFKESIVEYAYNLYKSKEKSNSKLISYILPKFRDVSHNNKLFIYLKRKCILFGKRAQYYVVNAIFICIRNALIIIILKYQRM